MDYGGGSPIEWRFTLSGSSAGTGYGGAPDRNIVARFRGAVSLESPDQVPSCYLSNDLSEVHYLHARQ